MRTNRFSLSLSVCVSLSYVLVVGGLGWHISYHHFPFEKQALFVEVAKIKGGSKIIKFEKGQFLSKFVFEATDFVEQKAVC